jgi:hypothetical protein
VSLARMLSGANAFEISDIQEDENKAALTKAIRNVTMLHWVDGVFGRDDSLRCSLGRVHLPELPPEHKFSRGIHDDPKLLS